MHFTKVELHNFGIYKGTHVMCLKNKSGNRNITLVGGLNGRGKTTFHDAVLLALYGRQALKYIQEKARSYEKLLVDHINKHTLDDITFIAVSICLDDGTNLRIKRSWQLKNGKLEQNVIVEKNGSEDKYLGESWSYYIEEILPFGIAKFFFFNNEKITQLADDITFEQVKTSIKSAIGISTIEKAIEHVDEVIKRKNNALLAFEKSELNTDFKEVNSKIKDVEKQITEAMNAYHNAEKIRDEYIAKIEIKEKEFWSTGGALSINRDKIQQEKKHISAEVEALQAEIKQISGNPSTPLFMCKNLVRQSYENELIYQQEEAKYYSNKIIFELHQQIVDKLSICGLDKMSFEKVKSVVDEVLVNKYSKAFIAQNRKSISAASKLLYEHLITEVFQNIIHQITVLISKIDEQENEILNLDIHLEKANEKTLAMQLFEALKFLEAKRAEADFEYEKYKKSLENLNYQYETLKSQRKNLYKSIVEKQNANDDNARILKYAVMSMDVLNEFKIRLQREKLNKLSNTITKCFKELVEKDSLVSNIKIESDTLDVIILDIDGNELLKTQLSAGEQQMFAVAVVWALAITSGYKAPVVVDTPMARLDSAHRTNFVTKYLPEASSQVVVLSTDEEIYGQYLDEIRDKIIDCYTLVYDENEQCTSVVRGYFEEE
jgi:DNA sulfur modification protein DndD